jgi:hypothetical protein
MFSMFRSRKQPPLAPSDPILVPPRVITLDASRIAELSILHGMKAEQARWDASEDPSPPNPQPPPTTTPNTSTADPLLPVASPSFSPGAVPASLRAELEELLGVALAPAGPPGTTPRLVPGHPSPNSQPTAAALQHLLSGDVVLTGSGRARVMRELEAAEVAAQGPAVSYKSALARLQKISPTHYKGPLGACRRGRLWMRINGPAVATGAACVLLVGGIAALCFFCPVAGIVIAAYAILVLGAGGAQRASGNV